jgi:hypothetical protein
MRRHVYSIVALLIFSLLAVGSADTDRSSSPAPSSSTGASGRSDVEDVRTTAAALFTSRYARSELSAWNVRGQAAGADCGVLLVTFSVNMDGSMIDAFHYSSSVYKGGVDHFYRERTFRGVVYRDASEQVWRYGLVSEDEARTASPC